MKGMRASRRPDDRSPLAVSLLRRKTARRRSPHPSNVAVFAEVSGNILTLYVYRRQIFTTDQRLAIVESMKMEISMQSLAHGVVANVFLRRGVGGMGGKDLFSLRPE
jgi:biotin carboxyl carrier protein